MSDSEAAYLVGSVFGAGSDTTASGISISVLAAACYPTEQQRVWEELDSVIGRERAPTLADQDQLPQTMAWVLEVLRWRPITAGGFPHKATRDILWVRNCSSKVFTLSYGCSEWISYSGWCDYNREYLVNWTRSCVFSGSRGVQASEVVKGKWADQGRYQVLPFRLWKEGLSWPTYGYRVSRAIGFRLFLFTIF